MRYLLAPSFESPWRPACPSLESRGEVKTWQHWNYHLFPCTAAVATPSLQNCNPHYIFNLVLFSPVLKPWNSSSSLYWCFNANIWCLWYIRWCDISCDGVSQLYVLAGVQRYWRCEPAGAMVYLSYMYLQMWRCEAAGAMVYLIKSPSGRGVQVTCPGAASPSGETVPCLARLGSF